jgi:Flp pilus assembly protein TadG
MKLRLRRQRRSGSILVEAAFVYPIVIMRVFGILSVGIAVFRYQQVQHAAREGARWAAVHGARRALEFNTTAATAADVYNNAIKPHTPGMKAPDLTYSVTWNSSNAQTSSTVVVVNGTSVIKTQSNTVSVTVSYNYHSALFGTIPVSSTAVMVMSY